MAVGVGAVAVGVGVGTVAAAVGVADASGKKTVGKNESIKKNMYVFNWIFDHVASRCMHPGR